MIKIILNYIIRSSEALFIHKASLLILFGFFLVQPVSAQVKSKVDSLSALVKPKVDSLSVPIKYTSTKKIVDTVVIKKHSPRKATMLSLIFPGLGQIYNHKYWKLPIVYGGFGTIGYFFKANHNEYVKFRNAYNFVTTPGSDKLPPVNDYVTRYNKNATLLLSGRDYYRRNLELTYIVAGALYVLVAIDAQVDAQFFNFDVSDDLSLNLKPFVQQPSKLTPGVAGVSLCFSF
jgi:hypothetical protein